MTVTLVERFCVDVDSRSVSGFFRVRDRELHFARVRHLLLSGELM